MEVVSTECTFWTLSATSTGFFILSLLVLILLPETCLLITLPNDPLYLVIFAALNAGARSAVCDRAYSYLLEYPLVLADAGCRI